MQFSDVAPGTRRLPESATRCNAVNALLRQENGNENAASASIPDGAVTFCNISGQEIPRFTAVAVAGEYENRSDEIPYWRFDGQITAAGIPAVDDELPWGIALETVAPGGTGLLALTGVVPAFFSGNGQWVAPGAAGLSAGSSGKAEVIFLPLTSNGVDFPGLVILGNSPAAVSVSTGDGYNGCFKLQALSEYSVEILYGSSPDLAYCGFTDVPGLENIPRSVLTFTDTAKKEIYLLFFYDRESETYSCRFDAMIAGDAVFYLYIGSFQRGSVMQSFRSNESRYLFGNDWYLK